MPMFVQTGSAAATEEPARLLSSPISQIYHDIENHDINDTDEIHASSFSYSNLRQSHSRVNTVIYPPKDQIPDVNSPQVKAWVAEIDWSKVPNIPVAPGLQEIPHFPQCPPDDQLDLSTCWWSCAGCVAESDVVTCPNKNTWGLTYDDGPSLASRDMMYYLKEKNLTATFFIVGSRVLEYPDILKEEVAQGHHIAMHTWSHSGLTTLTNHQIVAEIKWSEKIIRDVTGLTMKYVRPPYGDIDNRVREILRQMGYTIVIWSAGWDTNDWRMLQNQIQEWEIVKSFESHLGTRDNITSSVGKPGGPVTLEHDLTNATVSLSKRLIPMAMEKGLTPMNLAHCLSDITPYQHGSKLGSNGALEKVTDGEGKGSFRGMPGMEEQDFKSTLTNSATTMTTATVFWWGILGLALLTSTTLGL
ncbi:chitin deacetylase [Modicella reniformis]|uniref:Chitin deacetylase n=1 Tax=Modicella reniformis TaxID=1440133 RepID=A0A9P6MGA3_9FUNG|nr:chitin deacetylase [Modicella reniformis]